MILHLLHDCRIKGQTVRHREPIEFTEVKLTIANHLHFEGVRCDGTAIEAYGNRLACGDVVAYNENADTHDPDRHERTMREASTGREWVSQNYGEWHPLIDFGDQPGPEQPSLLDFAATA